MATLSPLELYQFDTVGLLRLPGFLAPEQVQALREDLQRMPEAPYGFEAVVRHERLHEQSPRFRALASDPALVRRVFDLVNQPLRLIESYALRRGAGSFLPLHNGLGEQLDLGGEYPATIARNLSQYHTYHDGRLYCMYVKVLVYLTDIASDEDGPFCWVQGSHKANFPLLRTLYEGRENGVPIAEQSPIPVEKLYVRAGDVVLLNESLMHGTLTKSSEGSREVAAFSYTPAFVSDWQPLEPEHLALTRIGHYETEVEEDFLADDFAPLSGIPAPE